MCVSPIDIQEHLHDILVAIISDCMPFLKFSVLVKLNWEREEPDEFLFLDALKECVIKGEDLSNKTMTALLPHASLHQHSVVNAWTPDEADDDEDEVMILYQLHS